MTNTATYTPDWFRWAQAHPGKSHFFNHEGARLHYLSWAENHSEKPVLLLLHGFRGHVGWWQFIAPLLTEHYQVYALDFSGMGNSEYRPAYDNDTHPQDILALMDHLGATTVTAVAHSFGGARVFRACGMQPQRFTKIIAVDAHVFFPGDLLPDDPAPQRDIRYYTDIDAAKSRFRLAPDQAICKNYLMDYLAERSLKQTEQGWTWKFDSALNVADFAVADGEQMLSKVHCPVDYIYGEKSPIVNKTMGQRIMSCLPQPQRLIEVPDGYHHLMMSHPEAVISTLKALL